MSVFDVAVIGAGAAGIAAARRLVAAGKQVVVLEARARAGGRTLVDRSLGFPADLGAAWLHFAKDNAWTTLADAAGAGVIRREPGWGSNAWIGAQPPTAEEQLAVGQHYARYYAAIEAAATAGQDVPLCAVIPDDAFRPCFDAVMTWAVGVESRDVSTLDLHRYADSDHNWAVREGLGDVVASAAAGLPVQLQTEVTHVDWSGSRVRIASSRGQLEARAVIVTIPTSLLARETLRFTPALPAAYPEAFENLPLGVANKVFFRLGAGQFSLADMRHFLGRTDTSRTCSYLLYPAEQPLLCAYFGGDLSRELELRGELQAFAHDELQQIFGADFTTRLGPSVATAWGGDPYARGSYSAARPGYAHCRNVLATPVAPQLQFAGEACSEQYFGTLHGAWLSGVAAAERLL